MPEDFIQKCSRLADKTDVIIPKVLEDGGKIVLAKVKSNLQAVIGRDTKYPSKSTGKLLAALGLSTARVDRKGDHNVKVGFSEPRRGGGGSNAKIANILEYGKSGQRPKPFLKPARASSRKACIEAMKARLEREIDGL
jgi:HK97 gp10 family phage protein